MCYIAHACSGCCSKGLLKQGFQGNDWEKLLRNVEELDPRPWCATYQYERCYWLLDWLKEKSTENHRKPWSSPSNIRVYSNLSLKPIQWNQELVIMAPYLSYWRAMLLALAIMDMFLELLFLISWLLGCCNPYWAMVFIPNSRLMPNIDIVLNVYL